MTLTKILLELRRVEGGGEMSARTREVVVALRPIIQRLDSLSEARFRSTQDDGAFRCPIELTHDELAALGELLEACGVPS